MDLDEESQDVPQETDAAPLDSSSQSSSTFIPPSVSEHKEDITVGRSYTYFSHIPASLLAPLNTAIAPTTSSSPSSQPQPSTSTSAPASTPQEQEQQQQQGQQQQQQPPPCVLGVDEAGRGPVLGPMVYGVFFLPLSQSDTLLRHANHRFDDSKALTPATRSALVRTLCDQTSDLYASCGWAVASLSARDISAHMLPPASSSSSGYNLNAQAMDATIDLINSVMARGVNVRHIFVDTIGPPATYQARLQRLFPTAVVTVAKKADSLYPCVSAASVCAKVTRDASLEELWRAHVRLNKQTSSAPDDASQGGNGGNSVMGWGSGYPSDARCTAWMRANMHPIFGWGPECRFSWGTAKDMLEAKGVKVDWPVPADSGDNGRLTDLFPTASAASAASTADDAYMNELSGWYGTSTGSDVF